MANLRVCAANHHMDFPHSHSGECVALPQTGQLRLSEVK